MFDKLKFWHDSEALGSELQIFHDSIVSQFPEGTWTKNKQTNKPNMEKWPESLGVMSKLDRN